MPAAKRTAVLIALFMLILIGITCTTARAIDAQLHMNDQYMMQQFSMYPPDMRYNNFLTDISTRLNANIVKTFGEDKNITFYVCPGPLGFNAVSFHRFVVFDSLLLDTLRFLAKARVYYGNQDNAYINSLINRVAELHSLLQTGRFMPDYSNLENPYGLPPLPGQLNLEQQQQAQILFTAMLASWMAHEGSHCMRDHMKYRVQVMQQMSNRHADNQQFAETMNSYTNAKLSQELEIDADTHAARWLKNSGYPIEGYISWLKFGEKLEQAMGVDNAYLRTHPKSSVRIKHIREAYGGK